MAHDAERRWRRRLAGAAPSTKCVSSADRPAGRALGRARLPGGAGDVEVGPAVLAGEALQEHRRGDRAAGAAGRRWPCRRSCSSAPRRTPRRAACASTGRAPPRRPPAAAAASASSAREQARLRMPPERDHAGAGQRGDVDHHRRLEALGVGQRVAQDQPAFGIGVEDLDGLARHAGDHVARLDGACRSGMFSQVGIEADQVELRLAARRRRARCRARWPRRPCRTSSRPSRRPA